jgi:Rps23 Pro-64 3,4-dihydroxylase Tpa1-like proline 4-hydroxylase
MIIYKDTEFTENELDQIVDMGDKLESFDAEVFSPGGQVELPRTRLGKVSRPVSSGWDWLYKRFGVIFKQFPNVENIEVFQYTTYEEGDHYTWHTDNGAGDDKSIRRRISATLQLSNPLDYAGGQLEVKPFGSDVALEMPKNRGCLTLFPSQYYHRVTPVTLGIRKALIAWGTL